MLLIYFYFFCFRIEIMFENKNFQGLFKKMLLLNFNLSSFLSFYSFLILSIFFSIILHLSHSTYILLYHSTPFSFCLSSSLSFYTFFFSFSCRLKIYPNVLRRWLMSLTRIVKTSFQSLPRKSFNQMFV